MDQTTDRARAPTKPSEDAPALPLRIGDWDVDATTNLIRSSGEEVRLEPKAMEVLWFLAMRPGQVVTRYELLSSLWPGLIVGDDTLTQAVIKLRKALGDDPRAPRYIETVPKRGYRLIAGMVLPEDSAPAAPETRSDGPGADAWLVPAVAGVAATSMLAVGLWLHHGPKPAAPAHDSAAALVMSASSAVPGREQPTVIVKPFHLIGNHPEQRYLADGLAAELAADLSRMSGLRVIRADPTSPSVADRRRGIGRAVFLVSGAIQRIDERIAVEVSLEDAKNGHELWSERYYRPFGDLFVIRDEIEARLAASFSARINEARRARHSPRYGRSVDAYDVFLKAKAALVAHTEEGNEAAEALYREAIELDAAFARAYVGLALVHVAAYRNQWTEDRAAALARAADMARAAARIDSSIPEAHWVLGYVSAQHRRHQEALAHLDQALAVAPRFADAIALKGGINTYLGNPTASLPLMRDAMRLNPNAGHLYFLLLGRAYFFVGDLEQANRNLRESLVRNPENLEARLYLAAALGNAGDLDGAEWEAEEVRSLVPEFSTHRWLEAYPMTDEHQRRALASALEPLNL